jgi:hypothetical protein
MMINTAWDEYRGWAARARQLQESSQKWNRAALISAAAAAILGAAASQTAGDPVIGKTLSLLAAIAAGLTPILGKEILSLGSEAKWIRARATAEAIKSECFRLAARAGDYAEPDAEAKFTQRLETLTADAVQAKLTQKQDPVTDKGDKRRPPDHLDANWYIANRIDDQIKYYRDKQREHEQAVTRLRYVAFGASAAAALFGVAGLANQQVFAPWIGAMTTIATAVAAYGLLDRRQYLAASFGAMATGLGRLNARFRSLAFAEFVTHAEDLMQSEHAAWTERMTQTIPAPAPAAAPAAPPPTKPETNKTGG